MYKCIKTDDERGMAISANSLPKPAIEHDKAMVHHMQGRHLIELFPKNKKYCIEVVSNTQQP